MIQRRAFLAIAVPVLAAPLTVEAQGPRRAVRVGWLGLASPGPEVLRIVDAFKQGLREFGYVENENIAFEYRWAHGRSERLSELAGELVRLKVDIIATASSLGVVAAKQATSTIPIVIVAGGGTLMRSASAHASRDLAGTSQGSPSPRAQK